MIKIGNMMAMSLTGRTFDRRMLRHMRKELDSIGEKMWLGEIKSVFEMNQGEFSVHCEEVMRKVEERSR